MKKTKLNIGIIGVGTVGCATIDLIYRNADIILARSGFNISIKRAVVRDISKSRECLEGRGILLSENIEDIINDDEIDVVIELMGGVDLAYEVAKQTLIAKKTLITANKAMLAYHRYDLQKNFSHTSIYFEASVAGGVPIINALRNGLSANHILEICGILNGTCNYILSKMSKEKVGFDDCLKEAQTLGYAEPNPTLDISGMDSAHKLLILSSIAYGIVAMPEDILVEGITGISQDDFYFANEFGYVIKLLAIAKKIDEEVELRVHLAMINEDSMISKVSGAMNGISVVGDSVGEILYYGAGAGGDATASAVVADIIDFARGNLSPMLGFKKPLEFGLKLRDISMIESKYYLRLNVIDRAGAMASITSVLSKNNISIKMMIQKEAREGYAILLLSTHKSVEANIQSAISELENLDVVVQKPYMIRIQD